MITVGGKVLGRKKALFADFSVRPPDGVGEEGGTTLRHLIECVVRHEVAAFRKRQTDRQFVRVLTAREIADGAEAGTIAAGGSEIKPQTVDDAEAVATALQAFEDGMYVVVVDGAEQRDLGTQLFLKPDSRLTFVRLTLLAGG